MSSRQFVPVVDQETPRMERDDFSQDMQKHRSFDSPFIVRGDKPVKRGKFDRGWAHGTVGWGVQGFFGSTDADTGEHIKHKEREFTLVKDEFGRWINPKKKQRAAELRKKREDESEQQLEDDEDNGSIAETRHQSSDRDDDDAIERNRRSPRSSRRLHDEHEHKISYRQERYRSHASSLRDRKHPERSANEKGRDHHVREDRHSHGSHHQRNARSRSRSPRRQQRSRSRNRSPRRDRDRDDIKRHHRRRQSRSPPETVPGDSSGGKKWDPEWGWV